MGDWWHRNIIEPGKLPLLLALAAFVITFAVVRVITRLIRAGRGPFHDISAGDAHVHHVVPGVVLMCVGGFGTVASRGGGWTAAAMGVVFGVGAGLVLDEFALILYLHDVYWTEQGRKSVEVVVITTALVGILLTGVVPFGVNDLTPGQRLGRGGLLLSVLLNLLLVLVSLAKGKLWVAVLGVFLPPVALVGALRLARTGSPWAKLLYPHFPRTRARAERRTRGHDALWGRPRRWLDQILGGIPDDDPPR
ncbi:hypothetical protein [Streptomyces radicis]|uniref:Integral membrane protein n=1 Tax=Streptomyces radicis TaxID=1750517 RepID=A0A3A9WGP7_9ACTN|nr:hypothetical protein [Streptomyces radicis]RKN12208.1 hypothetical protein D7319_04860 [Streptomyces radicis]RKN25740.1 hypothetical protein D7318_05620 [Streptomyces radicis]